MDKLLSASVVPLQFRKNALLTGHIPYKSLASDPRVSYTIYVPAEAYNQRHPDGAEPGPNKLPLPLRRIYAVRRTVTVIPHRARRTKRYRLLQAIPT